MEGRTYIMVATHNEDTVRYTVERYGKERGRELGKELTMSVCVCVCVCVCVYRMHQAGISKDDGRVVFGQLMGMSDHVSSVLGEPE